jgi:radical SAM protein with 4Fe4S-binding SPASM domain
VGNHTYHARHGRSLGLACDGSFFADNGHTSAPLVVQWMATLHCELSCPHCLAVAANAGFSDMPQAMAFRLIDQIAELGVEEFLITGGEPFARKDLPVIVEHLAERGVSWSLNTATMPTGAQQQAMTKYPPTFVAVSLDGPEKVHDAFRGRKGAFHKGLEAIRFFSSLPDCAVAVGTTVTTFNFPHLRQTLPIVVESGAGSWGIHLLLPEGRAARRKDLFLSRRQLGKLLQFVARTRKYFPVNLADELGYLGDMEPLVRDVPWTCGAGRAQCVVLPDGEVVPCTTLDRSTSAGNINDQPLADIWRDGFTELRNWKPRGQCASCKYAPACGGGCWLQHRAGTQCYRELWHIPDAVKTAAGVAICLGLLATAQPGQAQQERTSSAAVRLVKSDITTETGGGIEEQIVRYYMHNLSGFEQSSIGSRPTATKFKHSMDKILAADPAGKFFTIYTAGKLPADISGRSKAIVEALKTGQRSLALSALLWRSMAEICLDGNAPAQRTEGERKALRETLGAMETATLKWRKEIFDKKLDPYIARGRVHLRHRFEMSKAVRSAPPWAYLIRDTAQERWGGGNIPKAKREALDGYIERHPYADEMKLNISDGTNTGLIIFSVAGSRTVKADGSFGIFDILIVPKFSSAQGETMELTISWPGEKISLKLSLSSGTELTYADLLALAYKQHTKLLDTAAERQLKFWSRTGYKKTNPLLAPAMRKRYTTGQNKAAPAASVAYWLADFWMF